jgi:N utilization substance protein B
MASRRRSRSYALQALYHVDLSAVSAHDALAQLWAGLLDGDGLDGDRPPESEEIEFTQRLVLGVVGNRDRIDELLDACSTNWRVPRMPVVDRNILRMAAFELLECTDIPATVSINEAVELAKRFGTRESRAFVNGIVDRLARQIGRVGAEAEGRR